MKGHGGEVTTDLRERAEHGEAFAQVMLGFLYEQGVLVVPNHVLAKKWYEGAARQGCLAGRYALALLIEDVEAERSLELLEDAAEKGFAPAQHLLGNRYLDSKLIEPDSERALRWTKAAADQGYLPAVSFLASMYEIGYHVEADKTKAMQYCREAAEMGGKFDAMKLASKLLEDGSAAAVAEGLKWLTLAARKGDSAAIGHLAHIYGFGLHGFEKNDQLFEIFIGLSVRLTCVDVDLMDIEFKDIDSDDDSDD